jgi:hypothetical protein
MLHDRCADGVAIAGASLASRSGKKEGNKSDNEGKPFHAQFLSGLDGRFIGRWFVQAFFCSKYAQFIADGEPDANRQIAMRTG